MKRNISTVLAVFLLSLVSVVWAATSYNQRQVEHHNRKAAEYQQQVATYQKKVADYQQKVAYHQSQSAKYCNASVGNGQIL